MANASLLVKSAGPLVTIQDVGRERLMRYGVPASGPMDRAAFAIANAALGNPVGACVIEVSIGGITLECTHGSVPVAIAGGGFRVVVDQANKSSWTVMTLRLGMSLSIRPGPWGSWTYLAFAGRLRAKSWLGSTSTHAVSGLGGGRVIAGQPLEIDSVVERDDLDRDLPCPDLAKPAREHSVVLGPQDRYFPRSAIESLLTQPFKLTDAFDRMGVRFSGPSLKPEAKLDMPSEALVRGSIQVAGDGTATVLLADHQTSGGYPKIATISSSHIDRFAQLRSGDAVRFVEVEPQPAVFAARSMDAARTSFLVALDSTRSSLAERLLSANLIDGVVSGHWSD